jgi:thiosulfate/3-mercaptopyruvate sulfurtransferase
MMSMACAPRGSRLGRDEDSPFGLIGVDELAARLSESGLAVVDARSGYAYNGWPTESCPRGGHIPGAELLAPDVVRAAKLHDAETIVVYGDELDDARELASVLMHDERIPSARIRLLDGGIAEWSADVERPLESLPRYEKLVHPEWLRRRLEGAVLVVEVSWQKKDRYIAGHIPGAIHLDTDDLEEAPLWNVVDARRLESALLRHGIARGRTVVLYGHSTTAAARAALVLLYAGVTDVRLLDGGVGAWLGAGLSLVSGDVAPVPVESFGTVVPARPELIDAIDDVPSIVENESARLVSVRGWDEFIGRTSGYSYIEPKGRIRGAVWGAAGEDAGSMGMLRNADGTARSARDLERRWKQQGFTRNQRLSFYCGTGWRASEAFFYAYAMGFPRISVYDGGWLEWSADDRRPVETGAPE